jgi:hypothetical protein
MMDTRTREVIPYCVGETDTFYADFDPPDMDATRRILDGRTISSATAALMNGAAGTIDQVAVVTSNTTINDVVIQANTGVKFRATGLTVATDGSETLVKITATLSDGAVKPLVFRFFVEP